jgi:hypothetical protein
MLFNCVVSIFLFPQVSCVFCLHSHHTGHAIVGIRHRLDVGMRHGVELDVLGLVVGAEIDESALVLRRVAVPGRREDGDAVAGVLDLVALHAHLVAADDGFELVGLAEALGDVRAELETHAAL